MPSKSTYHFSEQQLEELRSAIKAYCNTELDIQMGDLQANLMIDFLDENIGKQYYNLGVYEAMKKLKENTDDLVILLKD